MKIAAVALAAAVLACLTAPARAGEGIAWHAPDGSVTLHTTDSKRPQGSIQLQQRGPDGKARCCVAAQVPDGPPPTETDRVIDVLGGRPVFVHRLKAAPVEDGMPFIGAAVFSTEAAARHRSPVSLELDGGTVVWACFSAEGFHLMAVSKGKLRTHLYHVLGYETKPTCPAPVMRLLSRS